VLNLLSRFALIKSLFFHLFNQGSEARRSAKRECVLSIYFMIILADYFMVLFQQVLSITGEKTHADQYFGSVQLDLFNTSLRFVLNLRASHSDAPYFFILVFLIFLSRFFSASLHN
jgi:hypothetical protein